MTPHSLPIRVSYGGVICDLTLICFLFLSMQFCMKYRVILDRVIRALCISLQWRHNERNGLSNHRCLHCLLNCCFRLRSKKTSKFCVTGFCTGNSLVTGEFPAQKASNTENISIWWCHNVVSCLWMINHIRKYSIPCNYMSHITPSGRPVYSHMAFYGIAKNWARSLIIPKILWLV